jgi:hypothetical protein
MWWVVNDTHRPLYPRERPGVRSIEGWVGLKIDLYRCGKSSPHWDSIPEHSTPSKLVYRLSYPGPRRISLQQAHILCRYQNFVVGYGQVFKVMNDMFMYSYLHFSVSMHF